MRRCPPPPQNIFCTVPGLVQSPGWSAGHETGGRSGEKGVLAALQELCQNSPQPATQPGKSLRDPGKGGNRETTTGPDRAERGRSSPHVRPRQGGGLQPRPCPVWQQVLAASWSERRRRGPPSSGLRGCRAGAGPRPVEKTNTNTILNR